MRANISKTIDAVLDGIEAELMTTGRHVIRTATIKTRAQGYHPSGYRTSDDDINYLADNGMAQVIQSRLFSRGYRSIRTGLFINIDTCTNIEYLRIILNNAEQTAEEKAKVAARLKILLDGQSGMKFDPETMDFLGWQEKPTEESFVADLEADAI